MSAARRRPAGAPSRRLLLVHAHRDDETIGTGASMAKYAAEGAHVTLVTCTLGEEGEVLVPALGHLAAGAGDQLGGYRMAELAAATRELGVADVRFLGGAGRWRDSGMMGLPQNDAPRAFWRADLAEATRALVAVIRDVRPQVLVTYDENGGYGHPDHIQAHRVAMAAHAAAADPLFAPETGDPWAVAKVYWTAVPRSQLPTGVPDELVTTAVDGSAHLDAKLAALRAHATQITVDGRFFALADGVAQPVFATECFRLVRGRAGAPDGPGRRETDLFAGLV